jgi:hypothetical protein
MHHEHGGVGRNVERAGGGGRETRGQPPGEQGRCRRLRRSGTGARPPGPRERRAAGGRPPWPWHAAPAAVEPIHPVVGACAIDAAAVPPRAPVAWLRPRVRRDDGLVLVVEGDDLAAQRLVRRAPRWGLGICCLLVGPDPEAPGAPTGLRQRQPDQREGVLDICPLRGGGRCGQAGTGAKGLRGSGPGGWGCAAVSWWVLGQVVVASRVAIRTMVETAVAVGGQARLRCWPMWRSVRPSATVFSQPKGSSTRSELCWLVEWPTWPVVQASMARVRLMVVGATWG